MIEIDPYEDIDTLGVFKMKFDVVIGNPPYQKNKDIKTEKKKGTIGGDLWSAFVEKSLDLCNEDGYVSLIHPPMWRKPEHKIFDLLKQYKIKYLEIHNEKDGIKTFGAATRYDWYVVQKTKCNDKTKIIDELGNRNNINLKELPFLINYDYELFNKIVAKDGEEKCEVLFSYSAYETRKPWMSKTKDDVFKYPCVHGLQKDNGVVYWYSNINSKGHFGIPKVILTWGRFQYPVVDFGGKYGMTQIVFGLKIDSAEEGENIKNAINSQDFEKIIASSKWSPFQTEWRMFKYFRKDFWKEFV